MQETKGIRNVLLTVLALVLLFGIALAVPSGAVRETPEEYSDTEDEGGDDEFDFLLDND